MDFSDGNTFETNNIICFCFSHERRVPYRIFQLRKICDNEVIHTQQIASERIHVERTIQRLKCYHIFDRPIPLSMVGTLNQIITVSAMLANFDDSIIKDSGKEEH